MLLLTRRNNFKMINTKTEVEEVKQVSIRGRVAFCAICLEKALSKLDLSSPITEKIVNLLWEFTETNDFVDWERKATEISPDTVLENHPDNNFADYETLSVDYLNELENAYSSMPEEIIELISWSLEAGAANLYGNTGAYSEITLEAVRNGIDIMNKLQIELPDINFLKFSKFQEEFGWGKPFKRSILPAESTV